MARWDGRLCLMRRGTQQYHICHATGVHVRACCLAQVIVDGVNVKSLSTRWLRSKVGLVGQDAVVFNASILENIRMGSPDATNAQVDKESFRESSGCTTAGYCSFQDTV